MRKRTELLLGLAVILALVASCAPAVTPQVVEKEVVVEKPVVQTVVVEKVVVVEKPVVQTVVVEKVVIPTPVPPPGGLKRGGILTWARESIPVNMDPVWNESNINIWIYPNIYEPLVRVTLDGTGLEPALAESWDISDDGLVYTFHLRPGVTWHDGSPLKASDVVWSLNRARDPEAGVYSWILGNLDDVKAVDNSTVEITLKSPSEADLSMLSVFNTNILPQKLEEMGEEEFFKHPIGTGPFKFVSWVPGDYIEFERNPDYWEMGADGQPLPYLDGVRVIQVSEASTRVMQVQTGEIDGTDTIPLNMIEQLEADPNISVLLFPSTQTNYIVPNHRRAPFDDVKVRHALNYAIDKKAMIDVVLFGAGSPAISFLSWRNMAWNPDLEGFPYDLERAKQLMAESNYPDGYTGIKINVGAGSATAESVATMVKEMWAEIGIEVELNMLDPALAWQKITEADFDFGGGSWVDDVPDPLPHVAYTAVDPVYHAGWDSPGHDRVVELAEAAAVELDHDKRMEIYHEIQEIFNEEAVFILLYHTPFTVPVRYDVKAFTQSPLGSLWWKETWLDR